jgi:uncharacterized protein YbjT (DUF2867 family)
MRFLVVGATGYVGRNVVRAAALAGYEVVAHVRPESPSGDRAAAAFVAAGARVVRTAWNAAAWTTMLGDELPDRIFLLLGTTAARARASAAAGGPDASQSAVDYGLTHLAITAARTAAPGAGIVYLSALGASVTGNAYLRVRARIEAALLDGPNPFTVVRPSFVTGPDRDEARLGERLGAIVVDRICQVLRVFGGRRRAARWASVTGPDLAQLLVALAAGPLDRQVHELDDLRR